MATPVEAIADGWAGCFSPGLPGSGMDKPPPLRQTSLTGWRGSQGFAMTDIVYKIVAEPLWREAKSSGRFHGAEIDLADGYIHFSTGQQARETAKLHFSGMTGLMLVAVDATVLGDALKFEPSRGGDLFPHLYGSLPISAVLWDMPLLIGVDGQHAFPEKMP